MLLIFWNIVLFLLASFFLLAQPVWATEARSPEVQADLATFENVVQSLLAKKCVLCHNTQLASGGLNLNTVLTLDSVLERRETWTKILQKLRTGQMPPPGAERPLAGEVDALVNLVQNLFDRQDRRASLDPGRVTVRRLNRNEYSNTIRDLLGVEFHAEKDFPTDDSGHGFDNIGDVLTISPMLMERYVAAAEKISAKALGADPRPAKPLVAEYHIKNKTIRRLNPSTIELTHRIQWDGAYAVRVGLPGQRGPDGKPVIMGFWMDGKLLNKTSVETKPSQLVYFGSYSEAEMRLYLPEGDHFFRAGFIQDEFVKGLSDADLYDNKKNKFINSVTFVGPFPGEEEKTKRQRLLICDPNLGSACVEKILSTLARKAYRRPVTRQEVASLSKFVDMAQAEGQTVEEGLQLALQAVLVSPHFLFRVEHDPDPADPKHIHTISDTELASRLSYFLWSSMPDNELLRLAEGGKLHDPGVLEVQVKRMLADERSAALADNFVGQWLETRNLDTVEPDLQKFPEWGPDLRNAMKTETSMFFNAILRENRSLSDFLDGSFTFLNDVLAQHYGITGISGPEFRRVDLNGEQRGGILSQASVLTISSYSNRTSPVIRGKFVLQNILGAPPPPPPADVPVLDEEGVGKTGSLRQQLEKHRSNSVCASCHGRMDVLGFGLENYDALGKWRTQDGKFPIDASGTLPNGKSFSGPAELRVLLKADLPDFARCLTEKMLTYSLGRGLEKCDNITVDEVLRKLAASDYRFQTLVQEIVHSLPFQSRRGEDSRLPLKSSVARNEPEPSAVKPEEIVR